MNILITAIGSFSADCVINTLKKNGHKVIGTDIYPREWHAVSNDCYKVYKAPLATKEKEYIDFLLQVTAKENINCIIPLTDLEIDIINKNRERFKKDIILCMQSANTLKIARNKLELSKIFQFDENINIPYFTTSKELKENFKIPAIAKPFNGRSSEGIILSLIHI